MEPTAVTIVSQLIIDARSRHGVDAVVALEVPAGLLDETLDAVLELGGRVGVDRCTVDGVEIRELPEDEPVARAWLAGDDQPRRLDPLEG